MKVFAIALAAVLLAGCSESSSTDGHVSRYPYDPALCTTLLPDTGGRAITENLHTYQMNESAYSKLYNRAWLEGVLAASGEETQKFVSAMGIELSKAPYRGAQNTCLFQHSLPDVSGPSADDWETAAGGDHGGGYLDGLFVWEFDGRNTREAIIVREDASRWTLVHEMMHANFSRVRIALGTRSGSALRRDVTSQYAALKADYAAYQRSPSPQLLSTLVKEADDLARLLNQSLVAGSLEEIADESLLLQEWSNGRLKYVSETSVENAAWYIEQSRTRALRDLNEFAEVITSMRAQIGTEATGRFEPTLDFIKSINTQTDLLAERARQIAQPLKRSAAVALRFIPNAANHAHVEAMSNTPALIEFRAQTADFLKSF